MATVNKNFRVKNGLVVEGTTATVDGSPILTEASTTFLDGLIKDVSGNLLENATLTNIQVTYNDETNALAVTAENGVADSDTDDLSEGSANLYYTLERAQDAAASIFEGTHNGITFSYDEPTNVMTATVTSDAIDALDTDDIEEGVSNLYFTSARAKTSAAELLVNATKTNITITGDGDGLTITAENGVADSDTDDLSEGSTNLYFTDARAQAAVAQDITDAIDAIDTDDIEEGATNLYFTDQRALDATSSAYDAAGAAATAESNANDYTDGRETAITSAYETYADDAVSTHAAVTSTHGVSGDIVGTSDAQTLTNKTMGDDLLMDGNQISGLAAPTQADHAATKSYVDAVSEGLHVHEQVHAIVTTPLATITGDTVVYDNGTSGVGATLTLSTALDLAGGDLDGDTDISTTERVLIAGEATAAHNGIYVITSTTVLTRADDFDKPSEMAGGDFVFVTHGTNYADTGWVLSEPVTTVGTDAVSFIQFSGAGTFLAGNGLTLDGNTFEIDESITATRTFVTDSIDALDTDAIEEGSSNLYFTDQRAVDALEAVTPNFVEVELNSVATQVAATTNLATTAETVVYSFAKASYRTAKFLVKAAYGTHTEVSEILLTLDTSDNVAITEYAIVSTNGSLIDVTADINGLDVEVTATAGTADTDVTIVGTLVA